MAAPQITVSIVSFNTRELLRECLAALEPLRDELGLQIIVADNASSDGSLEMVQREFPTVEAFATGGNLGFGRAHNLAFERARAPFFLILNSDAVLSAQDLGQLHDFLRANPRAGAVAPQLFYPDGTPQASHSADPVLSGVFWQQTFLGEIKSRIFRSQHAVLTAATEVDQLPGACILLRSEAFAAIGGFDARFWMYVEDVDLNLRLRREGWKIYLLPSARASHRLGGSSRDWRGRARMVAAFNRSQMIFFGSHSGKYGGASAARFVKFWTIFGAMLRLALWMPLAIFRPSARDKIRVFRYVLRATWRMKL